jgi:hypothetical protein
MIAFRTKCFVLKKKLKAVMLVGNQSLPSVQTKVAGHLDWQALPGAPKIRRKV